MGTDHIGAPAIPPSAVTVEAGDSLLIVVPDWDTLDATELAKFAEFLPGVNVAVIVASAVVHQRNAGRGVRPECDCNLPGVTPCGEHCPCVCHSGGTK